jgi:phospholipid/cholesterol/gamma-HCH transport system substrate-binding protein
MQKQAPTVGKMVTMVLFALSCFGLLLFLWLAFGGPIPLKPMGYRFEVAIPKANQLAEEADVRTSGVPVGKIREKRQDPDGNRTIVAVELDRKYAPIARDARVIQRSKTLLGEKYLEITMGTPGAPRLPEGGRLPDARVQETVELDEVLDILDEPTRELFRTWQQDGGAAVQRRGVELNDAFGTLPRWTASGTDLLTVLDEQEGALGRLVRNTGVVFGALTEREGQLRNLVVNTDRVFETTARQQEALADTFRIMPTFLDESRATMRNLESFSRQARPVIRGLRPAVAELRPTLRDVRALSPDLERFFRNLDPLIDVSRQGLPALRETLRGLRPMLEQLQPFLEELNPILEWLETHQRHTADFFSNGAGALVDTNPGQQTPEERGHYLGQFGITGPETAVLRSARPPESRGNAYIDPSMIIGHETTRRMIIPSWDCKNTGRGEFTTQKRGSEDLPSCWVKRLPGPTRFPQIGKADYGQGGG